MNDKILEIEMERDFTISKIEQYIFIASAIFLSKKYICDNAKDIYDNPDTVCFPYNKELTLNNYKTTKNKGPELLEYDGFGNFANEMIIISSASVLENYLRKIGKIFELNKSKMVPCPKCGYRREPLPHSFDRIAKRINEIVMIEDIEGYEHSFLLTLIRHKIIHNRGNADDDFIKKVKGLKCEESNRYSKKETNLTISIPIDKIVLPCLGKSIKFVENSSDLFISHPKEAKI